MVSVILQFHTVPSLLGAPAGARRSGLPLLEWGCRPRPPGELALSESALRPAPPASVLLWL